MTLFDELVRFNRALHLLRHLANPGGTQVSMPLLGVLAAKGPLRSRDLAAAICLDPSTVSRQIDQLVRAGFAERLADPDDGRATLVCVTTAGAQTFTAHRAHLEQVLMSSVFDDWEPADLDTFTRLLARLNDEALAVLPALAREYSPTTRVS